MTEEQIKAHQNIFARRYNIDIWKSSHEQSTPSITRWRDKRIIRDYNIHILFRTHEWDIVKYYSPMKNSSFLEIKVVPKMCKNCFWNPSWSQGWLEVKVKNVINCLKDEGCFQNASECPFSSYPPPLPASHFSRDFM